MTRGRARFLRRAFILFGGLLLAAAAAVSLPPSRKALQPALRAIAWAWWAARLESPICSRLQLVACLDENFLTSEASALISSRIHPVHRDSQGFRLWRGPIGDWWFPGQVGEDYVRFAFAQYRATAYPGLKFPPGAVVLDCGGYVGDWAHWALQHGASRVIVFEPASAQLECIRRNLAEPIRQGRVTLIPKGVWDQPGKLTLNIVPENPAANNIGDSPANATETIELTTIDAAVEELRLGRVDAIKMDIEGAEVRALRGARRTLARFRPQLAVATEHTADQEQNNRNVIQTMREIAPGYRMRCGYCVLRANGTRIIPETLYFYPD